MVQVTLTLSDPVYEEAERVARKNNRPVESVLAETLEQALAPFSVNERRPQMLREVAAFEAMRKALWERYPNQYVALREAEVIDHDADKVELLRRIRAGRSPDDVVLIRQVLAADTPPLNFRSPRFVQE